MGIGVDSNKGFVRMQTEDNHLACLNIEDLREQNYTHQVVCSNSNLILGEIRGINGDDSTSLGVSYTAWRQKDDQCDDLSIIPLMIRDSIVGSKAFNLVEDSTEPVVVGGALRAKITWTIAPLTM